MTDKLWTIDWHTLFVPQGSLVELLVRGTIMYLMIFVLLRVVLKRQIGGIGTSDILVVVLLAEVAGSGFGNDYKSVVEGAVLVGVVLFWSYAVDWLQHRFPTIERLLREKEVRLINNGRMNRRAMKQEMVTVDELMAQLRENGVDDPKQVKAAYMESDGRVSVIPMRRR